MIVAPAADRHLIMPSRTRLLVAIVVSGLAHAPGAFAEIMLGESSGMQFGFEGLVQIDGTWYDEDTVALDDDQELRRSELVLKGKTERWDWVVGYDPSERNEKWLDVNARFKLGERWRVTLGQFKQPNSLEELSSTRNNDFIAKAMITGSFGVGRRLGIGVGWAGPNNVNVNAGWFGRELTDEGAEGAGYGVRAAWAPVLDDERIVHLGLSAARYDTADDSTRLRARPGMDMSTTPRLVDTGTFRDADDITLVGLEGVWVAGPFKLQGEYMRHEVARLQHGDFRGDGGYLSGQWNLGGKRWGYRDGVITTTQPKDAGSLWQLSARIESIDFNDGAVRGGRETNVTVGVNWYWGRHVKLQANYVCADIERGDGSKERPDAIAARVQFHW